MYSEKITNSFTIHTKEKKFHLSIKQFIFQFVANFGIAFFYRYFASVW